VRREGRNHCGDPRTSFLKPQASSLTCPRGAAWSARRPVTAEIVGSNPIGDAFGLLHVGTVRKQAKRPSSNLGDCGFDSRLCHSMRNYPSAGHRRAQVAVNHPPLAVQVQLLPDGLLLMR
jgi:hypothetical protein